MRRSRLRLVLLLGLGLPWVAAGAVYGISEARLGRSYPVVLPALVVPTDAASVERGRHLARVVTQCTTCHGDDLAGQVMADDFWLGRLDAPNLTRGVGGFADGSASDLSRAIRHGVGRDARPLLLMPAHYLRRLGEADVAAIIAYLRSLPPVDRAARAPRIGPLTRLLLALGQVPELLPAEGIDHARPADPPPAPASTASYGGYLVEAAGCKVCHHADLAGGLHPLALPGEPVPSDLRPDGPLARWSLEDFVRSLRTGVTPERRALDARFMPWPAIGQMTDLELQAIWLHLRSLPRS